jgi:hypothetical protein
VSAEYFPPPDRWIVAVMEHIDISSAAIRPRIVAIFVLPSVRWRSYASLGAARVRVAMRYSRLADVEPAAGLFEQGPQVLVHYVAVIASVVDIQIAGPVAAPHRSGGVGIWDRGL